MDQRKAILYITYDGLTDPLGQSQILPYIFGLSQKGYRFAIVSFEKPDRLGKYGNEMKEKLSRYNILWYYGTFRSSLPFLSKMTDLAEMHRLSRRAYEEIKPGIVHCRSYVASLAGLALKKKYGVPFIFDMRGLWADERFDAGIWSRKNPLRRMQYWHFIRKEKDFLVRAAHVVSLTHKAIGILEERHQLRQLKNKSTIVRTCADTKIFNTAMRGENRSEIRQVLGIGDDVFLLVYSGSTGTWYMMKEMLVFFKIWLERKPDSRLLLLTNSSSGELNQWLSDDIRDKVIVRSAPYAEVCKWLNACDAGMYFIHPWFSKNASTATKTGEMAACGLPVVANAIGDMESVFGQYKLGVLVNDFSIESFNIATDRLIQMLGEKIEIPSEYKLEEAVEKYERVYKDVLGE
jgi:glycosyltransferase involved in cell wall biosynthesis